MLRCVLCLIIQLCPTMLQNLKQGDDSSFESHGLAFKRERQMVSANYWK